MRTVLCSLDQLENFNCQINWSSVVGRRWSSSPNHQLPISFFVSRRWSSSPQSPITDLFLHRSSVVGRPWSFSIFKPARRQAGCLIFKFSNFQIPSSPIPLPPGFAALHNRRQVCHCTFLQLAPGKAGRQAQVVLASLL